LGPSSSSFLGEVVDLVLFLLMIPPSIGFSRGLRLPLAKVSHYSQLSACFDSLC